MYTNRPFYGRLYELSLLHEEMKKKTSSLVVIHGRRRIGKSRLIEEFSKKINTAYFSGMPPSVQVTTQSQKNEFSRQFSRTFNAPVVKNEDWGELFWMLSRETRSGKWLIVLDEISWMGSKDSDFLGKLKNAWDLQFSKNPNLMLILCGSVSSWIEKNILSNTGFLGRISVDLILEELPLADCLQFWGSNRERISSYEMFKVLSVTGGVPKYLEEIIPSKPAEDNILRLCFTPQGLLFREFEQIFSDLFSKRNEMYRKVISTIAEGPLDLNAICKKMHLRKGGHISKYLSDLEEAGFIHADWTWNIKSKKISKLRKYRLSDNYLRFYIKYIFPKKELIYQKTFALRSLATFPNWTSIMGLQFENLVIANRWALYRALNINPADIEIANPFFQRKTARQKGCQIDFLIQTYQNILYLIEIKFSQSKIGLHVEQEMQEKIANLNRSKGFSIRTVLVQVNGVTEELKNSSMVDYIIDFADLVCPRIYSSVIA